MLLYRLFFVAIVLACFLIAPASSTTVFAGEVLLFQEDKKPAAKVKPEKKERLSLIHI